jgi:hypothetical protein
MILYDYIPKELVNIILEYDGRIIYKNGKYKLNINNAIYNCIKLNMIIKKKIVTQFPFYSRVIYKIQLDPSRNIIWMYFILEDDNESWIFPDKIYNMNFYNLPIYYVNGLKII